MCLICVEIAQSKMTFDEVRNALPEMIATAKNSEDKAHYQELQSANDEKMKQIAQKTIPQTPPE